MGGPTLLSALLFPVHERTKATAFGCISAGFGIAVSYIIAPLLVPDPSHMQNYTSVMFHNSMYKFTSHNILQWEIN